MQTKYDIIIIGAGAAGLFTAIESPAYLSKLILEKNKNPGVKVLLSGGERANVSNMDIETSRDYFGQNKKALISIFKKFNNYDIISFFAENSINIIEEDRGRLILESGDSRELLNLLLKKSRENNTELKCDSPVLDIKKDGEIFKIICETETFLAEKVVITCGGKSFSQVGTTGDGYAWAEKLGHSIIKPHKGLCGLVTKKDLSEISGVSCDLKIELFSKTDKKAIYLEYGPFLFTHFGVSGPIIFNTGVALGEYINKLRIDNGELIINEEEFIKENIFLKLEFDLEKTPKRVLKFFDLSEDNKEVILELQDYRSWKEAKVTGGGVSIDELTNNLESKLIPGLYFAGEVLDITGKTGGFNLQFAWSSGSVVGKSL